MKKEELIPYLQSFVTLVTEDGSRHSGYISNPEEVKNASDDSFSVALLNGFFSQNIRASEIAAVEIPSRQETVSIPVVDLKKGYETEALLKPEDFRNYHGPIDQELTDLYLEYIERFHKRADERADLDFDLMNLDEFKDCIRKCLKQNEPVNVVMNSFMQAFYRAFHKE